MGARSRLSTAPLEICRTALALDWVLLENGRVRPPLANPRCEPIVGIGGAAWLGVAHFVVDAVCVTSVLRASPPSDGITYSALAFVLGYDLLAFAGQVPCGWMIDRLCLRRGAAVAGLILTTLTLLLGRDGGVPVLVAAGVGNALFHVGAGAMTLAGSNGHAAPAGVFVAPGALGLGLGVILGRKLSAVGVWFFYPAIIVSLLAVLLVSTRSSAVTGGPAGPSSRPLPELLVIAVLLSLSVAVRSLVGTVGCDGCPRSFFLLVAIPAAAFFGKLSGGFLADRLGWIDVSTVALVASAPLLAFSQGDLWIALPGLLIFQMTMPVTLVAMFRLMPGRPALGFGILCLALVGGTLPAYLPGGFRPQGIALLLLVLGSAVALFLALRMLLSAPRPQATLAAAGTEPSPSTLCRGNP